MPTLLVTGASGYLGASLARGAAARDWAVRGTHLRHVPAGIPSVAVDVRDATAVEAAVRDAAPDAIVHTAYRQDDPDAAAINVDGAGHVARAARAAGARLVHLSTDVVFGGDERRPLRESDPVGPVTDYGRTKAEAETRVAAADPDAVIVRTSLLYGGPDGPASKHEELVLDVLRGGRDWTFFDDEVRCPIQVEDLAAALLELATLRVAGPLHVAGADAVDRLAFARLVAAAAGEDPDRLRGGPAPADRPRHCVLDSSRARDLLRTDLRGVRAVFA